MAGIEGFYPKKGKKHTQIPVITEGRDAAREAPDEDLDEYIKEIIIEKTQASVTKMMKASEPQGTSHEGSSHQATGHHWIISSSKVTTRVYHMTDAQPKDAIRKITRWEKEGEDADHAIETNVEYLTKQVVGVPADDEGYTTLVANNSSTLVKKEIDDDELDAITKALNHIVTGDDDDE
jgi:hypothetical protein